MTTMRECRLTYINAILQKKEELKGQLQNMVNETITDIKELKVDTVLNEAGLPSEEQESVNTAAIAQKIQDFNDEVNGFVENGF